MLYCFDEASPAGLVFGGVVRSVEGEAPVLEIGPFHVVEDFPGALGADHVDGGDVWLLDGIVRGGWKVEGKMSEVGYGAGSFKRWMG